MMRKMVCFLFLCACTVLSAADFIVPEILPQAVIHKQGVSRSQWLWDADAPITDGAKCYFRLKFRLPAKPVGARLNIKYDDSGITYINGVRCLPKDALKHLKAGKNVIAMELRNGASASGVLLFGEIKFADGRTRYLHSDKSVVACMNPAEGWEKTDFDDHEWKNARLQGDAAAAPWARYAYYVPNYTTPAEFRRYNREISEALKLPAGLEQEPEPQAKIVYQGAIPKIDINGKLYDVHWVLSDSNNVWLDNIILKTMALGFDFYRVTLSDEIFYKGPGKYDFSMLDTMARRILNLNPNAKLMVVMRLGMLKWCQENRDEIIGYASGPVDFKNGDEYRGRACRASAASEAYRKETCQVIRSFADFVKKQPWGKRLVAVRPSYGIYTEWHTYGMYHAPDNGKAMTRQFRKFLTDRYKSDAALQKAWSDPAVTLKTATVPSVEERTGGGSLLDPVKHRKTLDFYDCLSNTTVDLMFLWAREVKKNLPGRLCGAYYGYVFSSHTPEGANILLDRVLANPDIDFLSDPPIYSKVSRQAGGPFTHRTITASHLRYGKLVTVDDDMRFHHLPGFTESYATRTPLESYMCMRRNYCNLLFDNSGIQLCDPIRGKGVRPHAFDNADVLKAMQESIAAVKKLGHVPAESGLDMAVVTNYMDRFQRDGSPKTTPLMYHIFAEAPIHLYRIGAAFDMLSLNDFLATNKKYKKVLFLSCFAPTDEQRAALLKKVSEPGITCIWLAAPGCVTKNGFSDQAMSALAQMQLAGSGVKADVKCVDPAAEKLPGNIYRKTLDNKSVMIFKAFPPKNTKEWRNLLQLANVHFYCEKDNYFRRRGDVFMYHTGTAGKHTVRLPDEYAQASVTEYFSGKKYNGNVIELTSEGPGTWLFKINR